MRSTLRCIVALLFMAHVSMAEDANAGNPQKKFKGPVSVETGGGVQQRWSEEKAWAWHKAQPLLIGFNYLPATAINSTEMWQADTFDPKTIDAELALAGQNGFNCARVFLQYLVWENDPMGHEKRLEEFLAIAKKHGIRTLIVFFDDCAFSTMTEPFLGKQPNVIPGEYANGWTPSPGPKRVLDRAAWPKLEAYVRATVERFRDDPRVLGWDVYNEPSNTGMGNKSLPLVEAAFAWTRAAKPSQPLTAGVWGGTPESTRACLELSDVISFHSYGKAPELERKIAELRNEGRPILCTEWLNRPGGSDVETCLPVLAGQRVGAFHWGLVNGKTQTQFPWGSKAGAPEPKVWQHDIFRKDRTPYDEKELALFRDTIRKDLPMAAMVAGQWPVDKARAWYATQPWLVGCNFVPSTAVNAIEMWQTETFDPVTIERELGWAKQIGFNTVRVFHNFVVWKADANGLKKRFDQFLAIASKLGIRAMPVLFDDCNFAGGVPHPGKQPEPTPGFHNSQWVGSPPPAMVSDMNAWPELERYVKDMVTSFKNEPRIVIWDLYNEPSAVGSDLLLVASFRWARECSPAQPLTFGAWEGWNKYTDAIIAQSDVISFHGYGGKDGVLGRIIDLKKRGRPVICSEWMSRPAGSRFDIDLPMFKKEQVGCYQWGLVNGRTQTHLIMHDPKEPVLWQHDILHRDGTPYSPAEIYAIKHATGIIATPPTTLVPTSEDQQITWSFTTDTPAGEWSKPGFDESAWKKGKAPFASNDCKPTTEWKSADIWIRRVIELPAEVKGLVALRIQYDDETEVYLNGICAARLSGFIANYALHDITPEARATLQPGRNLVAIHCHNKAGGQFVDAGLVLLDEGKPE